MLDNRNQLQTNSLLTQILEAETANSNLLAIIASEAERIRELLEKLASHTAYEVSDPTTYDAADIVRRQEPKP